MSLFGVHSVSKGTVLEVVHMVERLFKDRNLDVHSQQVEEAAGYGWWLKDGDTKVYIFVQETPTGPVLRITAPILHIPSTNLEAFYRKLLDINSDLSNCALSIHQNIVLVVAQRHTLALDPEELDEILSNVAYIANLLGSKLAIEFNTQLYTEK